MIIYQLCLNFSNFYQLINYELSLSNIDDDQYSHSLFYFKYSIRHQ